LSDANITARARLLKRLDEIVQSAIASGHALAVLALGSSGRELDRVDEYSDLDLWVIAEEGYQQSFLADMDWIQAASPLIHRHKHGPTGYSLLFEDGIFAEVDAFEMSDLASLGFTEARIAWKRPEIPDTIRLPHKETKPGQRALEEMLGEALGNLYVGLGRFHRGEKLTAMRFVQVYAVDRLLEMARLLETEQPYWPDVFGNERRFEKRFPRIATTLPKLLQGYERTPESAQAMLEFLDEHFKINPALKQAIAGRFKPPQAEN
jgi:lincosamide nucleotidyltransferase